MFSPVEFSAAVEVLRCSLDRTEEYFQHDVFPVTVQRERESVCLLRPVRPVLFTVCILEETLRVTDEGVKPTVISEPCL